MTATNPSTVKLVADIGGTNARFALVTGEGTVPVHAKTLAAREYPGLVEAVEAYLDQGKLPRPREAAVAIANPINGDWVKMTNHTWAFSIEQTRLALKLERLLMLNDFAALALSLPMLGAADLRKIGAGTPEPNRPLALIGAGTGLGVSALVPSPTGWIPLEGEGGHATFSPADALEAEILRLVWRDHPHVSFERLVSGMGLENLYRVLTQIEGRTPGLLTPTEITQRALSGIDPLCVKTATVFCSMLGTAASNLVVTLGARGGVYIGGGIVPRLGAFFDAPFRKRFEEKGRFSGYLANVPSYVILASDPALIGAAQALRRSDGL
jgi:glucokinase